MKYHFFIDQEAISNAGLLDKTDVFDWMILSYIKEWGDTQSGIRKGSKTWINFQHLIDDMPMLNIRTKAGISNRFKKLVDLGLLLTDLDFFEQKLFAETTKYYSQILYSKDIKAVQKQKQTVNLDEQTVNLGEQTVNLDEQTVNLGEQTVNLGEPIHIPVSIHQDSNTKCNAKALARFYPQDEQKQKPQVTYLEAVLPWYREQGYTEDINLHFRHFNKRLQSFDRIPRDLVGYFKKVIQEDWAGLREDKSNPGIAHPVIHPWAKLPEDENKLWRFCQEHGFPDRLGMLPLRDLRGALRKEIALRLEMYADYGRDEYLARKIRRVEAA